jgi:hypothetical protein
MSRSRYADCITGGMRSAEVGLWIDSSRAVIVFAKSLTAHLVEAQRYGPRRYYDTVITALGTQGPVLIIGPGDAKTEIQERIEHGGRPSGWVVAVEPSTSTSNRDILAELSERLHAT